MGVFWGVPQDGVPTLWGCIAVSYRMGTPTLWGRIGTPQYSQLKVWGTRGGGTATMPGGPQYASPPPWAEGCGVGAISFRKQSRKGPGGGRGGPVGSTPTSVATMQKGLFGAGGAHVGTLPPPPSMSHLHPRPQVPPRPPPNGSHTVCKKSVLVQKPHFGGGGEEVGWGGAHMGWDEGPHSPPSTEGGGGPHFQHHPSAPRPQTLFLLGGASPPKLCFLGGGGDWTGILPPSPPHPPPPH